MLWHIIVYRAGGPFGARGMPGGRAGSRSPRAGTCRSCAAIDFWLPNDIKVFDKLLTTWLLVTCKLFVFEKYQWPRQGGGELIDASCAPGSPMDAYASCSRWEERFDTPPPPGSNSEATNVLLELIQKLLYTTPSRRWWWCIEPVFRILLWPRAPGRADKQSVVLVAYQGCSVFRI